MVMFDRVHKMAIPSYIVDSSLYSETFKGRDVSSKEFEDVFGSHHLHPKDINQLLKSVDYFGSTNIPYDYIKENVNQIVLSDLEGLGIYHDVSDVMKTESLNDAVKTNNANLIRWALEKYGRDDLSSVFMTAIKLGCQHSVEVLLDEGVRDDMALVLACKKGHNNVVVLLLSRGADVDARDGWPLRWACYFGYTEIVKTLLNAGADMHLQNDASLLSACEKGHAKIVDVLLSKGDFEQTSLNMAVINASGFGQALVVDLLIEKAVASERAYDRALESAAVHGHTDVVEKLIVAGADVNAFCILDDAAFNGHIEIVKSLIRFSVNVNQNRRGNALVTACMQGHKEVVEILIAAGANTHDYALRIASMHGKADIVKILIHAGASIQDAALCVACHHGHLEVVELLISAGANVHAQGTAALHQAILRGHTDIVRLLLRAGAKPEGNFVRTARAGGYYEIADILIEADDVVCF